MPWDEFSRCFYEFLNIPLPDETPPMYPFSLSVHTHTHTKAPTRT